MSTASTIPAFEALVALLFTCAIVGRLIFFPSGDDDATNDGEIRIKLSLATSAWFVEHLGRVLDEEDPNTAAQYHVVMVLTNACSFTA